MDVKKIGIIVGIVVLLILGVGIGAYQRGAADTRDNTRAETNTARERELLARIGEYEQRERKRIAAENSRIERERKRIERVKSAIATIRGLDRRSGDLLQELEQEIGILEDYFIGSERELGRYRGDGAGDNAAVEVGD